MLPTRRETSSIPKAGGSLWEYPSPQQMYNAMRRKGFDDAPEDAVESMVAVHNWLNEGVWADICAWEGKFSGGCSPTSASATASASASASTSRLPTATVPE